VDLKSHLIKPCFVITQKCCGAGTCQSRWWPGYEPDIRSSIPGRVGYFSSPQRADRLQGTSSPLSSEYRSYVLGRLSSYGVKLTIHLLVVPRLRIRGAIPPRLHGIVFFFILLKIWQHRSLHMKTLLHFRVRKCLGGESSHGESSASQIPPAQRSVTPENSDSTSAIRKGQRSKSGERIRFAMLWLKLYFLTCQCRSSALKMEAVCSSKNVGIYLLVRTASQLRTTLTSSPPWEPHISEMNLRVP
jgi:hypothetical protein